VKWWIELRSSTFSWEMLVTFNKHKKNWGSGHGNQKTIKNINHIDVYNLSLLRNYL
jgi:hypothetical protein